VERDDTEVGCVVCHGLEGEELGRSVHLHGGVGCTVCHGGDAQALDKDAAHGPDLRALSDPRASVESCGGCHADLEQMRAFGLRTDQLAQYWTSLHGERLKADGDPNVATCVSCHGVHEVLRTTDSRSPASPLRAPETCGSCHGDAALMEPYGLDPTTPEQYRRSVHGEALLDRGHTSSPSCPDCHGAHGATPPRVSDVGNVCGHCHSTVADYFESSPHIAAVRAGWMEECTSCHGDHGVQAPSGDMLLGAEPGHCGSCHEEGSGAFAAAQALHAGLEEFDERVRDAERSLAEAAESGLFIDEEHGYLDEAHALRVRAKTLTHTVSPEALEDLLNRGTAMVDDTLESLALKRRAWRDRKIITAMFLAVTLLLAGVLLVHRREIAGGWDEGERGKGTSSTGGGGR
jgi:predicted CXXCH cytochrome family protein